MEVGRVSPLLLFSRLHIAEVDHSMPEFSDQFPVTWDDPAAALRHWEFDPMHSPDVLTPLGFELLEEQFLKGFGLGTDVRLVNHYMFMHVELDAKRVETLTGGRTETVEVYGATNHYRFANLSGRYCF